MSALPRPELPPGPRRELSDELHALHHRAGWPSLRTLAREAGCSHTTVSAVFSAPRLPSWGTLELIVEAMAGDARTFHELWLAASAPDDPTPSATPRAAIAGRHEELAALSRHLETGAGLLLVTGEAGIGKTRLVTTAGARTPPGTFIATGYCLPLSSEVPFLPVADALRAVHESDGGPWLRQALSTCPPYVASSLGLLVPELAHLRDPASGPGDEWSRQRLFSAVAAALASLGAQRPLGLLIEDLHWADTATLDLLEHLLSRGPTVPLVGTWRLDDHEVAPRNVEWFNRLRRRPGTVTLPLRPLDREDTREQLTLLGRDPSDELLDSIHRRSLGQPLFTEQLASQTDTDGPLPALLADLLDARLGDLTGPAWATARTLGVAGRPLSCRQLTEMASLDVAEMDAGLRELDGRRLLAPSREHDVALRHPLLAEAIRRRLVASEAAVVHARVAAVLASSPEPEPGEIARHWERAGVPEHELTWRIRAAHEARQRFASAQEADQWLRVIDLWPGAGGPSPSSISLVGVHVAAIEALHLASRTQRAIELAGKAVLSLSDATGTERADLVTVAGALIGTVDPERGLALLDEGLGIHESGAPDLRLALCLKDRSDLLRALGRYDEGASAAARAVSILRGSDDPVRLRLLLADHAWYQLAQGDAAAGFATLAEASALRVANAGPHREIRFGCQHTDMLLLDGRPPGEVAAAAQPALALASSWGIETLNAGLLRANVARAQTRAGQPRDALATLQLGGDSPAADHWMLIAELAHLDVLGGELGTAAARFEQLETVPIVNFRREGEVVEARAECDLWLGRPQHALERTVRFLESTLTRPAVGFVGGVFVMAARAAADCPPPATRAPGTGPGTALEVLLDLRARSAVDPFASRPVPADRPAWAAAWEAEIARLTGEETVEQWVAAAVEWDRLTRPHDAAYCRWRAAQVASKEGQGTAAARLLKRAAHDAREHVPLRSAIDEPQVR